MQEYSQLSDTELGINFFTDRPHVGRFSSSRSQWTGQTFILLLWIASVRCQKSSRYNIYSCLSTQKQIFWMNIFYKVRVWIHIGFTSEFQIHIFFHWWLCCLFSRSYLKLRVSSWVLKHMVTFLLFWSMKVIRTNIFCLNVWWYLNIFAGFLIWWQKFILLFCWHVQILCHLFVTLFFSQVKSVLSLY
jgi:hypothetical protein